MLPILFSSEYLLIPAWHTFYMLGALAAFMSMKRLARLHIPKLDIRFVSQLFSVCYISGYFGARIFSIFVDEADLTTTWERLGALAKFGPMTFYGGFIGAIGIGSLFVIAKKQPILDVIDISVPAGLIALGIGRIGCFLNGDDFGLPIPVSYGSNPPWWSVTFPNLEDGIARYPVQLMETVLVVALALAFIQQFDRLRRKYGPGFIGIIAVMGYGFERFGLEYLRGDDRGWVIPNQLSPSQLISMIFIMVGSLCLFLLKKVRQRRSLAE